MSCQALLGSRQAGILHTVRTNLLNWSNLISISKNVVFYVGKNLLIFGKFRLNVSDSKN